MSHPRGERSGEITGKMARGGDSREETAEERLKWHRNMALAAAIHEYAGLAGSGHGQGAVTCPVLVS